MDWDFVAHYSPTGHGEEATEGDVVSCMEYDPTGTYLAVGDRGGRVTVLTHSPGGAAEADHVARFQSHDVEFDFLKSIEIEEKINKIRWVPRRSCCHLLLTTNDKTAKLWKVGPTTAAAFAVTSSHLRRAQQQQASGKKRPAPTAPNLDPFGGEVPAQQLIASCRRVYGGVHQYNINALSLCSDGESFLSADDLRMELWHLEYGESMNVIDIKPPALEELSEVITAALFHPSHCSQFLFSTSKGHVRIGDLRQGSQSGGGQGLCFSAECGDGTRPFFKEILTNISDATWCGDGSQIVSRDFLTVKLWDVRVTRKPIVVLPVHDGVKQHLSALYENECIFDKFECSQGKGGSFVLTGSYRNLFRVFDLRSVMPGAAQSPSKKEPQVRSRLLEACAGRRRSPTARQAKGAEREKKDRWKGLRDRLRPKRRDDEKELHDEDPDRYEQADWAARIIPTAAHPLRHELAVASLNNLFIFSAEAGTG
eukprot:TRINITY_DN14287_c0_g1_i1.p1 TRINITY_DN14287_c0_g1~~TRINITY_DN14287_c0_g1_i1.p1  ORF type:complete len:481 (+),score=153.39 TRINITY_DN14287_c0_g1_i1:72-1514(+)